MRRYIIVKSRKWACKWIIYELIREDEHLIDFKYIGTTTLFYSTIPIGGRRIMSERKALLTHIDFIIVNNPSEIEKIIYPTL